MTKFVGEPIDSAILDFFELSNDTVQWVAAKPEAWQRRKKAPWGMIAGGDQIYMRGKLVRCSSCVLLTSDIRFALEHAGEWPWQFGGADSLDVRDALAAQDMAIWQANARKAWQLDQNGLVVWRETRGTNALDGEQARGFDLSGYRGKVISASGKRYLLTDVIKLLAD